MNEETRLLVADYVKASASELVDRQHELTFILKQYEAVKGGQARVVLLVGELGIGKTRILDEVAVHTAQGGATVLRGSASESEGMPPYLPFLEALGQYIRVTPLDQLREQVNVAPQLLASILPELAGRLGVLPETYPVPPEQARLRLHETIGNLLEAISIPHALILMLDDLQWADTVSLDLLCHIVRHHAKARLLVLGTYRQDEAVRNPALERAVIELVRQRVVTLLTVKSLSAREIQALAVNFLGQPIRPDVSHLLYAQSEGNPFYAEELLQSWVETGVLVQENRQWIAVAPLEHSLPPNIVGVLRQRFARLSPDIIDHLRIAAIIGRTFDARLLAEVEGSDVESVEEHLLEAAHAGLIHALREDAFTFSHDKIREYLYVELSTSRRRRLHEAIGRVLEARYNQTSVKSISQFTELAFHFTQSGDHVCAATYAQQAAEQALQVSAIEAAMGYYRIALEHLDRDNEQRCDLLLQLGKAALLAGVESEAVVAYEGALECQLQSGDREAAAQAAYGLGLAHRERGAMQEAQSAFERALMLLGNHPSALVVHVLVDLSVLLTIYMNEQAEGAIYAQQALEMARYLDDNRLEAAALRAVAGKPYVTGGDIPFAVQSLERALALAEASADWPEAAKCCLYLACAFYWTADIKRSYEVSFQGLEFIERSRQSYQLRNAYSWLALLRASQGTWSAARQAIEWAQSIVDHLSSPLPAAFLHQIRGFLAYQQEDYVTAESELRAARVSKRKGADQLLFFTGLLGLALVTLGKHEEVHSCISELEALLVELPADTLPTAPILVCLALIAIALGDRERATNLYSKLLAFRSQHYWFLVDRVLGELATLYGDLKMARIHLTEAEAAAQRAGLLPELARTLLAQATIEMAYDGQGRNTLHARDLLNRALGLFEELHMADSAQRARGRLQTLSGQPSLPADLTRRETEILRLVAEGKSNYQIAKELRISEKTVANHLSRIFSKTKSENRAAAATFAIRHNLA